MATAIAIAGIQFPWTKGNGLSKLHVGLDGQYSIHRDLGHHRCSRLLLNNPTVAVRRKGMGKGNEMAKIINAVSSIHRDLGHHRCSRLLLNNPTVAVRRKGMGKGNEMAKIINAVSSMEGGGVVSTSTSTSTTLNAPTLEDRVEMAIFNCRFLTLMAVVGSLSGSLLCFLKGGVYVFESFKEWFSSWLTHHGTGKVILLLVEALDVYLMGTVMLIFGMGLYGLFINNLEVVAENCGGQVSGTVCGSNLFGLFKLQERPKWLKTHSLEELKSKLGHVIVMVLLVGMFDKSKKIPINSSLDLVCFSTSILFSSGCLYLLSKLHSVH